MGSHSDYKTMQVTEKTLKKIGISFETKIISAHRTPKRMYEYARENKKVEIQEREIEIHEFIINNFSPPYVEFHIKCSKGTYIRSIANDFGKKLNSGSYLFELRRVNIGEHSVLNALKIE